MCLLFLIWGRIKGILGSMNMEGKGFYILWWTMLWVVFSLLLLFITT